MPRKARSLPRAIAPNKSGLPTSAVDGTSLADPVSGRVAQRLMKRDFTGPTISPTRSSYEPAMGNSHDAFHEVGEMGRGRCGKKDQTWKAWTPISFGMDELTSNDSKAEPDKKTKGTSEKYEIMDGTWKAWTPISFGMDALTSNDSKAEQDEKTRGRRRASGLVNVVPKTQAMNTGEVERPLRMDGTWKAWKPAYPPMPLSQATDDETLHPLTEPPLTELPLTEPTRAVMHQTLHASTDCCSITRVDTSDGRTWDKEYTAFKTPFEKVEQGYIILRDKLRKLRKSYPGISQLWKERITRMRIDYVYYAHQYRDIYRFRRKLENSQSLSDLSSVTWQRKKRKELLYGPLHESGRYALETIHALNELNHERLQRGLPPIKTKLKRNIHVCDAVFRDFGAIMEKKLERELTPETIYIEKELDKVTGPIVCWLKRQMDFVNELYRLRDFWRLQNKYVGMSKTQRRRWLQLAKLTKALQEYRSGSIVFVDGLEHAVEQRARIQWSINARKHNVVLSEINENSTPELRSPNQPCQTVMNFHRTAPSKVACFQTIRCDFEEHEIMTARDQSLGIPSAHAVSSTANQTATDISFRIPENAHKQAALVPSNAGKLYWQYTLYQGPAGENVVVHYCKSRETSDRIAKLFLDKPVIGFDIEWKPQASAAEGTKKNVSLVQLASEERVALFHIARYGKETCTDDLVPPNLKKIMESPDITKVGVAVKADCTRLRKFMGIRSKGLFELSHLYKLIKFSNGDVKKINKSLVSLAQQVEEHLLLPMWKGEVRSSDWSEELNYQQVQCKSPRTGYVGAGTNYGADAASDSYAGLQLYNTMEAKRKALDPMPPRPAHAELNLPIRLANGHKLATSNEPEEVEGQNLPPQGASSSEELPEIEQMARDFLNIAIEDVRHKSVTASVTATKRSRRVADKSPELAAAEVWITAWRSKLPTAYKPKATPAYLRAYAVWHDQEFDVPAIARLLRDPPLQLSTVSNYILEAIRMERLPYDLLRLKDVLAHCPDAVSEGRYKAFKRQLVRYVSSEEGFVGVRHCISSS